MAKYKVLRKCWRQGRLYERGDQVETDDKKVPAYFELLDEPKPKRTRKRKSASAKQESAPPEAPSADDVL